MDGTKQEDRDVFRGSIYRPDDGYTWIEKAYVEDFKGKSRQDLERRGPYLIRVNPEGYGAFYNPMEDNRLLFTEFADLSLNPRCGWSDAILRFANSYGALGKDVALTLTRGTERVIHGEHVKDWTRSIRDMWICFSLWEWIRKDDRASLGRCIERRSPRDIWLDFRFPDEFMLNAEGDNSEKPFGFGHHAAIASDNYHPEAFELWRDELPFLTRNGTYYPVIGPVKLYLARMLNKQLLKAASPQMRSDAAGNFGHFIVPHSLLGAMWLQFFEVFNGKNVLTRCEICNSWMDTTESNSNKRMHVACSNRNRQRRLREKRLGEQL
jgi:hypothetical protein